MAGFVANAQIHGYSLRQGGRSLAHQAFILLCALLIAPASVLRAQDAKTLELYNQGNKLFTERKPTEAITFMQEAIKRSPNFADAYLKLGQLYEFTKRNEAALGAYQNVIRIQPDLTASAAAYQATSNLLLRMGRYAEALPLLEQYLTAFAPQSSQAQRIQRMIANAQFGQQAVQNPQAVTPKPLAASLQTTLSQYFPVLTADEQTLVFTALKPEGDEDLMVSTFNGETWNTPTSLSPIINTTDNEGTPSLSADGRTLVFTACQNKRGFGSCDLYISRRTGDQWAEPQNLGPIVNTRFYESQPALSADGRRLYFVSDRPGGLGKRDIWRTDIDADGNWQTPVNIGTPVNTPFNEASPFIHANGRSLFFASDGHIGLGGYDLFVADNLLLARAINQAPGGELPKKEWAQPVNLGYPINNADDQASLFVSANGTRAYYSFEEQKEGVSQKSRLYNFDLPESLREKVKPVSYLKGIIADARTQKPLPAVIELIDLSTNQLVSRITADATTGEYITTLPSGGEYALYVSVPGYLFKSLSFDFTQKTKGEGLTLSVPLEPITPTGKDGAGRETLNNIFFESGRYDLAIKSRTELERLVTFMKANPSVKIEVAGHTDDQGEAATNLVLSRKRAQAVVDYLTRAGIEATRIQTNGYGEGKPLVPNTTDENRRLNRRIEWRVL